MKLCFGEKKRTSHCKIVFLDETELLQEIQTATVGHELLDTIFKHLNLIETAYFGLRYLDASAQTHWLDPNKKVAKQLKGTDPFTLYFGVKFYVSDPCKLLEEITRYQFFLQVKQDILQGRLPVNFELASELCSYAVQSELGDYDPHRHHPGYVAEFRFLANQNSELEMRVSEIHKTHAGQVPAVAELNFLEKVKWLDMYGVDLHPVLGEDNVEYFIGLTPSGVIVLRNKSKVGNYFWPRITKVYFKGKYFMLRVRDKNNEENTYGFELPSKQACKHLWKCCVEHHAFFRLTQVNAQTVNKMFPLSTSRFRYSGRTERQIQNELQQSQRAPPCVQRVPSRRYQRRVGQPDGIDNSLKDSGLQESERLETRSNISIPQPVHMPTAMYRSSSVPHGLPTSDSPRSIRSAPWEDPRHRGGMFSSSTNPSPRSVRSAGCKLVPYGTHHRSKRHGSVDSDDSRDGHSRRRRHRQRSHKASDNESELSKSSHHSRRHRSGSKHRDSSADSESVSSSRHSRHRNHRKKTGSNYELVDSTAQWKEVQRMQKERQVKKPQNAVVRDLTAASRKSGYINSGMESESEMSFNQRRKHRRHRSRSRSQSPPVEKRVPPDELRKHFEYDLVDANRVPSERMRDIPYTRVETEGKLFKVRYSPNTRQAYRTAPHSKNSGPRIHGPNAGMDRGDATTPPPPYATNNGTSLRLEDTSSPTSSSTTSHQEYAGRPTGNGYVPASQYITNNAKYPRGKHMNHDSGYQNDQSDSGVGTEGLEYGRHSGSPSGHFSNSSQSSGNMAPPPPNSTPGHPPTNYYLTNGLPSTYSQRYPPQNTLHINGQSVTTAGGQTVMSTTQSPWLPPKVAITRLGSPPPIHRPSQVTIGSTQQRTDSGNEMSTEL